MNMQLTLLLNCYEFNAANHYLNELLGIYLPRFWENVFGLFGFVSHEIPD